MPAPGYGKEINGDLLEGKRTLMIIHALRHADSADRRAAGRLPRTQPRGDALGSRRRLASATLLDRTGALEHARTVATRPGGAALYEFDTLLRRRRRKAATCSFMRSLITLGDATLALTAGGRDMNDGPTRSCSTARPATPAG